jgi:CBS domain-containing protein
MCSLPTVVPDRKEDHMKVSAMYTPEILSAGANEELIEVAARMQFHEVGALLVFHQGVLQGIVTERDLLCAVADGVDPTTATVERYMTRDPVTVTPDTDAGEAAAQMLALGARHLPVVDGGQVVGMLSARDLLPDVSWEAEPPKQAVSVP